MPKAKVNDIEMYYEIHGDGDPLVLIAGLGYGVWCWYKQIPALSQRHKVIVFDNRGVGGSDKPEGAYSIKMMADDTAGLLKALDVERAHILGTSMGGFIAQQFALDYAPMTRSLILCGTSFGGRNSVPMPVSTWKAMTEVEGLTPRQIIEQGHALAYSAGFRAAQAAELENLVDIRLANPVPREAWLRQFWAGAAFDLEARVPEIQAPTLVMTGGEDVVVPAENARLLAARIPHVRLLTVAGAGHAFFIERAEEFNRAVLEFLASVPA